VRSQMKLAVVIINYKTPGLVIDCLKSLQGQIDPASACVVVVDNLSPDNSVEILRNWIDEHDDQKTVQLIASNTNGGFSSGNNIGIRSVEAEYYLLLNSDTIVRPGALSALLDTADRFPKAGIVSPRLEWPDGTPQQSCFRYLSPVSELIDAAKTGIVTAALSKFNVPLPVSDIMISPQWTTFACVLVRREVIEEVGLMDDGFFMYFEDVEYCRRARKGHWDILHNPEARVVHLRGRSSPVKQRTIELKRLPHYFYAARTRYYFLAYGWIGLTIANLLWLSGRFVSKSRELLCLGGGGAPHRQWLDIWTNWLRPGTPWSDLQKR
jgi:N-acetylglucosaminyl-diphospho-decaprenol L-rhamnosyltransferase